jgi:hypothetical protein|nr:MAG TPA: hypothetical protein [Caudoviricetes sp.]
MANDIVKAANTPTLRRKASLMLYAPQQGQKAVDLRRALVQLPETLKGLTRIEQEIFTASTLKQLGEYEDTVQLVEMAKMLFRGIANDVGFIIPTNTEDWQYRQTRLLDMLRKYFPQMSLKDVKLAFELAMVGELDEYLPKDKYGKADKSHYQQFNTEYFSKILKAYEERQGIVFGKVFAKVPQLEATDEEQEKAMRKFANVLVEAFEHYKENGKLPQLTETQMFMCYKQLADNKLIEAEINEDDLHKAMAEVKQRIASRLIKPFQASIIRLQGESHEDVKTGAFKYAQHRAIEQCFDKLVKEGKNIKDYLK